MLDFIVAAANYCPMKISAKFPFMALLLLFLSACASDQAALQQEEPVEVLYNKALNELEAGSYIKAAQAFDEVERQHPYSVWATKAQIMGAYAWYQANKYDDAILAAERFIKLHPGHRDAPYAYYLVAISYYEQISDVGRDQKLTQLALDALRELVKRYPDTEYARDAKLKIDLTLDHLAGKEMAIGRYYLRQKRYVGAINRFRTVIEKYQTTTHVPEALERLTEAYLALGVDKEAQAAAAVLGYNYPGSEWYADAYALLTGKNLRPKASEDSWISRLFKNPFS